MACSCTSLPEAHGGLGGGVHQWEQPPPACVVSPRPWPLPPITSWEACLARDPVPVSRRHVAFTSAPLATHTTSRSPKPRVACPPCAWAVPSGV